MGFGIYRKPVLKRRMHMEVDQVVVLGFVEQRNSIWFLRKLWNGKSKESEGFELVAWVVRIRTVVTLTWICGYRYLDFIKSKIRKNLNFKPFFYICISMKKVLFSGVLKSYIYLTVVGKKLI